MYTYATEQAITEVLDDFDEIKQNENENETAFTARLNNTAYRCENVQEKDYKI